MVAICALALALSAPGQTAGISVFVDPMMAALDLTRSQVAFAYLVATLAGSTLLPRIGRLVDEIGPRRALLIIAVGFALALAGTSLVQGFASLTVAFFFLRLLGQGSLPIVASNAVAPWFVRRRGFAIGLTTAFGASLMSLVPIGSAALIRVSGWRVTWLVLAGVIALVLVPLAVRGIVDAPERLAQRPDGAAAPGIALGIAPGSDPAATSTTPPTPASPAASSAAARDVHAVSRSEALRTPAFWVLAGAVASTGAIGTSMKFHQIALLGEQGLDPIEAAANFLPQTAGVLLATIAGGALIDRIRLRWVLLAGMGFLVLAVTIVPSVAPGPTALVYGLLLGAAGSITRVAEAAATPKLYGLRELGAIRGVLRFVSVAASGLGPVVLAVGRDLTGSYGRTLSLMLVLPVVVAIAALFTSAGPRDGAAARR